MCALSPAHVRETPHFNIPPSPSSSSPPSSLLPKNAGENNRDRSFMYWLALLILIAYLWWSAIRQNETVDEVLEDLKKAAGICVFVVAVVIVLL